VKVNNTDRFKFLKFYLTDGVSNSYVSTYDFLGSLTNDTWGEISFTPGDGDVSDWDTIRFSLTACGTDDYTKVGSTEFCVEWLKLEVGENGSRFDSEVGRAYGPPLPVKRPPGRAPVLRPAVAVDLKGLQAGPPVVPQAGSPALPPGGQASVPDSPSPIRAAGRYRGTECSLEGGAPRPGGRRVLRSARGAEEALQRAAKVEAGEACA